MSDKPEVLLCRECRWSKPETHSEWNLRCHHPAVTRNDSRALSSGTAFSGTSCREERDHRWFAVCGMAGKRWRST